ncbi:F-actin-capping protein subunit beta [Hondaea fermentalgiana]|uniref:F-actin-capping protein subunit beta n=1 Tax=Hondaea fermentalgiana TaxID=2315210 RepID=A0A2R5GCT5_9STRA|nr:F-actin-capping protein subunit beta [Hondaea fermentalgiana]|eukprot:GBG28129.1 F-actin-capping protein subunit beta [Hondaea fermentalgiana]
MGDVEMNSALNIMRRMPPTKIELNLSGLVNLMPDLTDELLQRVDQPLQAAKDPVNGKQYLLSDYNRDADSYRSPWSNNYNPELPDGLKPSKTLRVLEEKCNAVFDSYRQLYYEGGVSSAYLWDQDEEGAFAGCFLIKKEVIEPQRKVSEGSWDSIHVVDVIPQAGAKWGKGTFEYHLTTTVMLAMVTSKGDAGDVTLSGSLTRQAKPKTLKIKSEDDHVVNIGSMIEEMEIDVRNQMDGLYIQKTREVVNSIRRPVHASDLPSQAFVADLTGAIKGMRMK